MSKEIELLRKQLAFWKSQTTCLIKALDEAEKQANHTAELLDKTEEELNAERVKSEWISVDERLPELLQDVLCYRGNFKGDLMNTYTYLGQGMWKDDYGINYSTEEDGITHWMPLPEPPITDKTE